MIDMNEILSELSNKRQIFHSEADFQFELAHSIRRSISIRESDDDIRLEYPITIDRRRRYIDIFSYEKQIAIELKYKTKKFSGIYNGEQFNLRNQAANDCGRYDFIMDISRLEALISSNEYHINKGYAIFLTNDASYQKIGKEKTYDSQFKIHEKNILLPGQHKWLGGKYFGSRKEPIEIKNHYTCEWKQFGELEYNFKYLLLEVAN